MIYDEEMKKIQRITLEMADALKSIFRKYENNDLLNSISFIHAIIIKTMVFDTKSNEEEEQKILEKSCERLKFSYQHVKIDKSDDFT